MMKHIILLVFIPFFSFGSYEKFFTSNSDNTSIASYVYENGRHYGYKKIFYSDMSNTDNDKILDAVCVLGINALQSLYSLRIFFVTPEDNCLHCGTKVRLDPRITLWSCKCDEIQQYSQEKLAAIFLRWEIEYRSKHQSLV